MSVHPIPPSSASDWIDYDYAVVRVVPLVHLGTFQNVGVVMHARTVGFLETRLYLNRNHLATLAPKLDMDLVARFLDAYQRVCQGGSRAGPIGLLPPSERFHWLTAPRSAALQTSPVHGGRTRDCHQTLEQLFKAHVEGA